MHVSPMQNVSDKKGGNNRRALERVQLIGSQQLCVNHDGTGGGIAVVYFRFDKFFRGPVPVAVDEKLKLFLVAKRTAFSSVSCETEGYPQ